MNVYRHVVKIPLDRIGCRNRTQDSLSARVQKDIQTFLKPIVTRTVGSSYKWHVLMFFQSLADHKVAMDKNASKKLHAGIYTQNGEIGKVWDRLRHEEKINEEAELKRLALAGIKRPTDRLRYIERHGQHPKHSGQTHLWRIRRKDGCFWMEDLRER